MSNCPFCEALGWLVDAQVYKETLPHERHEVVRRPVEHAVRERIATDLAQALWEIMERRAEATCPDCGAEAMNLCGRCELKQRCDLKRRGKRVAAVLKPGMAVRVVDEPVMTDGTACRPDYRDATCAACCGVVVGQPRALPTTGFWLADVRFSRTAFPADERIVPMWCHNLIPLAPAPGFEDAQ